MSDRKIHLTLTGSMSGTVICGHVKHSDNSRYVHAIYLDRLDPDLVCPKCKTIVESLEKMEEET